MTKKLLSHFYSLSDERIISIGLSQSCKQLVIDELGYQIYKSCTADLDKFDILIRVNETGEIWKIVKGSYSESMIGVSHTHMDILVFYRLKL